MSRQVLDFPIRSDKLRMTASIKAHLASHKSAFQQIDIYDTDVFGRMLFLDNHVQLAEMDEAAYHETLVHPALMAQENPTRALVVGGGDGGVIREICKHASITHVDMVEIDGDVVKLCREHLPSVSDGAFEDPRVHLHLTDAFPFVKEDHAPYDLIVVDATDTYEEEDGEISEMLFTDTFYADCLRLLSPTGFVVTQADNVLYCPYSLVEIQANFRRTFPEVGDYWASVPSFGGYSGICWAGRTPLQPQFRPERVSRLRYLDELNFRQGFLPLPFTVPGSPTS